MGREMSIGLLGDQDLVYKRKFRWTFVVEKICGSLSVPESLVKLASRPNLTIDETEINFLNAKDWIPGKGYWNTLNVTYIDAIKKSLGSGASSLSSLYTWIASVYDFREKGATQLNNGSRRRDYAAEGVLRLYDGCGSTLETWVLKNMWPTEVNWGEGDYASSEEFTIDLTLRYSNAEYIPGCGVNIVNPCCTPC